MRGASLTIDPGDRDLLLYQEDWGMAGNNFIGAKPNHPVIGAALRGAVEALNRGDNEMVWLMTGPGLLTRSLATFLAADVTQGLSKVMLMERYELYRSVAIHCATSYKYTTKHWSRTTFRSVVAANQPNQAGHGKAD